MYLKIFIIVLLIVGSIYDCKYLSLPKWLLLTSLLGGFGSVVFRLWTGEAYWGRVLGAMIPGLVMILLSRLAKEQIGCGDGLILLGMGGCMEYIEVMYSFWLALLLVFLVSAVLVVFKGVKYNIKLPFVPFLAMSSILVLGGELLLG